MRLIIAIAVLLIILNGTLGLRTDIKECDTNHAFSEPEQKALCYREYAITQAARGYAIDAKLACGMVRNLGSDSDYYNTQADLCYYDIAKLLLDSQICLDNIQDDTGNQITGSSASKSMCKDQVDKMRTAMGYQCNFIFVIPLLFTLLFLRRVHYF